MPIYEYRCSACGFEKDALQKLSDVPLVDCPGCGKPALVKQISAAGFQLKGSGWYATDFKSSGAAKPGAKPGSDAAADAKVAPATTTADAGGAKPAETAAAKSESTAPKPSPTPGAGD